MSKSLEELKRIANYPIDLGVDDRYEPPKSCGTVSIGLCFQEEFDLIKQDLERLEKLEKENQELKERYKRRAETSKELNEALTQHQKVIEILKDKLCVRNGTYSFSKDSYYLGVKGSFNNLKELTQEQYNLLKEVLE